jgi:putative spermidine/putrescine transport system substrate-binding protein
LVGGSALAFSGSASAQRAELIVTGFGGAYDQAMAESLRSFEQEHNVKVTIVPGTGANNIVRVRNKEIDVIVSDPIFALRMEAGGLFARLDRALVSNLATLHRSAVYSDYTVVANIGAHALAYNPATVSPPPTSWYELAKPEYRGRIGLRGFGPDSIELLVLFAKRAGGDERHPDAGWDEMATIARNVNVWITSHAQHLDLYRNDEISMSVWTDGRIRWAREEGASVQGAIPTEGFFPLASTLNIVAGRPNQELAQRLVNHLLGPESGIRIADALGYFPTNTAIALPSEVQARMMINPRNIDQVQSADWQYIVTVYDAWQERWERQIQR